MVFGGGLINRLKVGSIPACPICRCGGIGIHRRFKIFRSKDHAGSTPVNDMVEFFNVK